MTASAQSNRENVVDPVLPDPGSLGAGQFGKVTGEADLRRRGRSLLGSYRCRAMTLPRQGLKMRWPRFKSWSRVA